MTSKPPTERIDGIAVSHLVDRVDVSIDRPARRNSLDREALARLSLVVDAAVAAGARTLVLRGSQGVFCVGADLVELRDSSVDQAEVAALWSGVVTSLERTPLLTVAVVDGLCLGGGVELTLACDVRIATARSEFGFPEVLGGAIPSAGGTQRLPRFVGLGRAKRMLLLGERLRGAEAAAAGLVDVLVQDAVEGQQRADEMAARARETAPEVFRMIKSLALDSAETVLSEGLRRELDAEEALSDLFGD